MDIKQIKMAPEESLNNLLQMSSHKISSSCFRFCNQYHIRLQTAMMSDEWHVENHSFGFP